MRRIVLAVALGALSSLAACGSPPAAPQAAAAAAPAPAANWSLSPAQSRIAFGTVKAEHVGEGHRFKVMTGSVDPSGAFTLQIPLDSVETNVDIRNQRLREILFETATFANATLTGKIDLAAFQALANGEATEALLNGELDLHGVKAPIEAHVLVSRLSDNKVLVSTVEPVMIDAAAFQLDAGVKKLQEIAKLPSISPVAPVTANLVFER